MFSFFVPKARIPIIVFTLAVQGFPFPIKSFLFHTLHGFLVGVCPLDKPLPIIFFSAFWLVSHWFGRFIPALRKVLIEASSYPTNFIGLVLR